MAGPISVSIKTGIVMLCLSQVVTSGPVDDIPCPYDSCTCTKNNYYRQIQCDKDSMIDGAFPKLKSGQFPQKSLSIRDAGSPTINVEDLLPSLTIIEWRNPSSPNPLTTIPPAVLTLNLDILNVMYNNITSIDNVIFPSSLTVLYLDANPLTSIAPDAFKNLKQLRELYMSNTRFTRLPLALAELTNLGILDLGRYGNIPDLQCTCEESSLATWYKNRMDTKKWISDTFSIGGITIPNFPNGGGDCGVTWVANFLANIDEFCPA